MCSGNNFMAHYFGGYIMLYNCFRVVYDFDGFAGMRGTYTMSEYSQ